MRVILLMRIVLLTACFPVLRGRQAELALLSLAFFRAGVKTPVQLVPNLVEDVALGLDWK